MPLISKVGKNSPRARFALALIYFVLCLGGLTMVYPFLLMVSTATKGPTDQNDNKLLPAYLSDNYELFRKYVDDKYAGGIDVASAFYGLETATKLMSPSAAAGRVPAALSAPDAKRFEDFLLNLPLDQWQAGFRLGSGRISSRTTSMYQNWLRQKYETVANVNKIYLEQNIVMQTVTPPAERYETRRWKPANDQKWRDWLEFKASLSASFRIPITVRGMWQQYLRSRYNNQLARVPFDTRQSAQRFEAIPMEGTEFRAFFAQKMPERFQEQSPDKTWRLQTGESDLPLAAYDSYTVIKQAKKLQRDFLSRNFGFVLDYILLHGRAVWNTVLFCLLAVLTHLIVNPLAAYALSRFSLPSAGKILLFLLATMAFPAEVTMIPSFLLLRNLGLLNTFAALVLPTAASGYSIYLLKGFFDSLPRDLYESATMEGAKESTMLFRITLPLSKPVLAVIALTSFMAAYSAFMYAFLVAQNERMWTLTVWIYQLQSRAPKGVIMAALTLAALPTLVVFLAAQRVILRGIILPGEK